VKKTQTLSAFGRSSTALTELLRKGETLEPEDQAFIENHFVALHLAYSAWKHGKKP
jgi:hypothetical protein